MHVRAQKKAKDGLHCWFGLEAIEVHAWLYHLNEHYTHSTAFSTVSLHLKYINELGLKSACFWEDYSMWSLLQEKNIHFINKD